MSNPFALFDTAAQTAAARRAAEDAAAAQQQAETAEALKAKVAADAAARAAQRDEELLENFVTGFVHAVIKAADHSKWSVTAIQAAQQYSMALATRLDIAVPNIDPSMARVINDKFAYGIALQGDKFPSDWLNGQRQEWFPELFAKKSGQARSSRLDIQPGDRPRVHYSSTSTSRPVADLPPATTPKAKGKDRRPGVGKPGFRKETVNA